MLHGFYLVFAALMLASVLAACGGAGAPAVHSHPAEPAKDGRLVPQIPGVSQRMLGDGSQAVFVLTSTRAVRPRSTVIFLHGWYPYPPASYGPWLAHLVERGSTVIYPAIQTPSTRAHAAQANMLAGIRRAVADLPHITPPLVVAGVTTGGALAVDYAATAGAARLPIPTAAYAVYPGRNPGIGVIPWAKLDRIAPSTRLVVVDGGFDPVVNGAGEAKQLLRAARSVPARRGRLLQAADPSPAGPEEADAAARRSFWRPLDVLIGEIRRETKSGTR